MSADKLVCVSTVRKMNVELAMPYFSIFPSSEKGTTAAYIKQGKRNSRDIRETIMAGFDAGNCLLS